MKGIIFKDEMVRAILEGRKTMTRRPMKLKDFMPSSTRGYDWEFRDKRMLWHSVSTDRLIERYAPYKPGEIVYVKETWFCDDPVEAQDVMSRLQGVYYQATEVHPELFKWRPSIHMPEWASRINLHILSVGVERIQEISRLDAKMEGFWPSKYNGLEQWGGQSFGNAELAFRACWQSIYPGSWDRNDYVWKFEFEVTK